MRKFGFCHKGLFPKTEINFFFSQISSIIEYFAAFPPDFQLANALERLKQKSLLIATDAMRQSQTILFLGVLQQHW